MSLRVALIFLKFLIFSAESFNPTGGVNKLLFSGEKRVTFRTNFDSDVFLGRSDFNNVAAGALDGCLKILGMYIVFHCNFNPLLTILCIH